jgi:hypothetical protein
MNASYLFVLAHTLNCLSSAYSPGAASGDTGFSLSGELRRDLTQVQKGQWQGARSPTRSSGNCWASQVQLQLIYHPAMQSSAPCLFPQAARVDS